MYIPTCIRVFLSIRANELNACRLLTLKIVSTVVAKLSIRSFVFKNLRMIIHISDYFCFGQKIFSISILNGLKRVFFHEGIMKYSDIIYFI